jgi:hypothetical protein
VIKTRRARLDRPKDSNSGRSASACLLFPPESMRHVERLRRVERTSNVALGTLSVILRRSRRIIVICCAENPGICQPNQMRRSFVVLENATPQDDRVEDYSVPGLALFLFYLVCDATAAPHPLRGVVFRDGGA